MDVEEEDMEDDESEGLSTYKGYFSAGGGILLFLLLMLFNLIAQGAFNFSDVWLSFWFVHHFCNADADVCASGCCYIALPFSFI